MPNTSCDNGHMTKLFKIISDEYVNVGISTVPRRYFNETRGEVIESKVIIRA